MKVCETCGECIEKTLCIPLLDGTGRKMVKTVHCMCRCERERRDAIEARMQYEEERREINKLRRLSLLDAKSVGVSFKTFKVSDDNKRAFNIARRYVENFDGMLRQSQGLLFWGEVGTGKSYTAAAIANELIDRMIPVIMTSFVKLLDDMQERRLEETVYISRLNQAKLLIIDDLGAERGTDYALEKVYDIVDSRYRSGRPVIFTTNLTMKQMKECGDIRYNRIYDRIFEMCYPVKFDGLSWRKKDAAERYAVMREVLEG